jgi:hypothetical protein
MQFSWYQSIKASIIGAVSARASLEFGPGVSEAVGATVGCALDLIYFFVVKFLESRKG